MQTEGRATQNDGSFLHDLRRALLQLEEDRRLQDAGLQYYWAVDFAAIFAFIHRVPQGAMAGLGTEPKERRDARIMVALEWMFRETGQDYWLLPPYVEELTNHLAALRMDIKLAAFDLRNANQWKLARLIESSNAFREYQRARAEAGGDQDGSKVYRRALAAGIELFPELFAVISSSRERPLPTLRRLFDDRILASWPQADAGSDGRWESLARTRREWWKDVIFRERRGQREYQSQIDGWACALLEETNRHLREKARAVMLLTPSRHIVVAMDAALKEGQGSGVSHLGFVRDLNYVMVKATFGDDIARIRETTLWVEDLLRTLSCKSTLDETDRDELERLLGAVEPRWRRAENQALIARRLWVDETQAVDRDTGAAFMSFLCALVDAQRATRMVDAGVEFPELETLRKEIRAVDERIPGRDSLTALSSWQGSERGGQFEVTFPGLTGELAIVLRFNDAGTVRLAARAKQRSAAYRGKELDALRRQIIAEAQLPGATADERLLAGYLLALEGKDAAALDTLSFVVDGQPLERAEAAYVSAVIHRKRFEGERAEKWIDVALGVKSQDVRYRIERAKILWVRTREADERLTEVEALGYLEEALRELKHIRRAVRHDGRDPRLEATLANALAFLHVERFFRLRQKDDLLEASGQLVTLESVLAERRWIGRFHDTRGAVLYGQAIGNSELTRAERIFRLRKALSESDEAIKEEQANGELAVGARMRLLDFHRSRVIHALEEAGA